MRFRYRIIVICSYLVLTLSPLALNAQLLPDTANLRLVKQDIDYIYNMEFDKAQDVYAKIIKSYPGHPIVYLLRGMMNYWQNELSLFGKYGNEFTAYAYFGLSRITDDSSGKNTRKIYRKEAMKLAEFKKINFDK